MKFIDFLKSEVVDSGIRVGCSQAVRAVQGVVSSIIPNPRVQSFLNSAVGSGILTSAAGFGLAHFTGHEGAQAIARECRIMGLAKAGNGVAEQLFKSKKTEEKE